VRPLHRSNRLFRLSHRALIALAVVIAASVAGAAVLLRSSSSGPGTHTPHAHTETTYSCPMHPSYKSDQPGSCPICSMKLVPLESGEAPKPDGTAPMTQRTEAPAPSIVISPERQQQIGIRFSPVMRMPVTVEVRAVGKVAFDESQITHVHSKVSGWIEEVFIDFVGAPVKRGQPLFTIYSPDLVASQEEYLLALRAERELGSSSFDRVASGSRALVESARRRLALWDMTPAQIRALEKRGQVSRTVTVFSPESGIVTERAAYHHGRYVTPELDLYTIVRFDRVWVIANVYEYELPNVAVGQEVVATLPYDAAHAPLRGKVSFVQPYLDPATRTAQVRFEFPNEDGALRPETFVNVSLKRDLGTALVVPKDAVMDTGESQYVFVDRGEGRLEPRLIRTGAEVSSGRIVLDGLVEDDRVVTAANFVVDSESRLKGAFDAMTRVSGAEAPTPGAAPANLRAEVETDPSPAKVGENTVRVRVSDAAGAPVVGAEVEVRLFMPQMGSMAPMEATAQLREEETGVYEGRIDVPMAWTWETTIRVRRNAQELGTIATTITAR
jgi:membrane fusion protein, copper/silver efflux system